MTSLFVEDGKRLESTIDFSRLLKALKTSWWKIVLFSGGITLIFIPLIMMLTPTYESYSSLMLKAELSHSTTFEKTVNFDSTRARYFDTQYELLKSRQIVEKVIKNLDLDKNPEFIGGISVSEQNKQERLNRSVDYMYRHMNILPIRNTQLVSIGFESKNNQIAADVANEIAKVFVEFSIEDDKQINSKVIHFLDKQVADAHAELKQKEEALNVFLKDENLINFYGVDGFPSKKLTLLTEDLATARTQRLALETQYNTVLEYQRQGDLRDLMSIPDVARHPNIENLLQQLTDQRALLSQLKERYGPKHEKVIQAQSQLLVLENQSQNLIKDIAEGIKNQYKAAVFKENQLKSAMDSHANDFHLLGVKKTKYDRMVDDINHTRSLYNQLLQRLNETQIDNRFNESAAKIIDLALVPNKPTKPNKPLLISAVAVLSLMLAIMLVMIFSALNNRIMTIWDLQKRLGLNVLGEIREYESSKQTKVKGRLTGSKQNRDDKTEKSGIKSRFSKSSKETLNIQDALKNSIKFKALDAASLAMRSQILLLDSPHKVLSVTSATAGEGKTLVSALVSKSMAVDYKVLLVDMDLRSRELTELLDCSENKGLLDILYDDVPVSEAVSKQPWFDFLSVGNAYSGSPLVALTNKNIFRVCEELKQQYDYIIIDTPAILDYKDSALIAQFVDAGILVVKANYNSANLLLNALNIIKNTKILGGVLNCVDEQQLEFTENLNILPVEEVIS